MTRWKRKRDREKEKERDVKSVLFLCSPLSSLESEFHKDFIKHIRERLHLISST